MCWRFARQREIRLNEEHLNESWLVSSRGRVGVRACIGGKIGSYSVWQPTDTRSLGGACVTGSTGGGRVGVLRTGGGGSGFGGSWIGAGGGEACIMCWGAAGTGSLMCGGCGGGERGGGGGGGGGGGMGTGSCWTGKGRFGSSKTGGRRGAGGERGGSTFLTGRGDSGGIMIWRRRGRRRENREQETSGEVEVNAEYFLENCRAHWSKPCRPHSRPRQRGNAAVWTWRWRPPSASRHTVYVAAPSVRSRTFPAAPRWGGPERCSCSRWRVPSSCAGDRLWTWGERWESPSCVWSLIWSGGGGCERLITRPQLRQHQQVSHRQDAVSEPTVTLACFRPSKLSHTNFTANRWGRLDDMPSREWVKARARSVPPASVWRFRPARIS